MSTSFHRMEVWELVLDIGADFVGAIMWVLRTPNVGHLKDL